MTPVTPSKERNEAPTPDRIVEIPSPNINSLFQYRKQELQWDLPFGFRGGSRREGRKLMAWSFMASLIDALILIALTCVFLIAFAFLMRSSIGSIFVSAYQQGAEVVLSALLISTSWLYLVSCRVFWGFTLGEWACRLRLGEPSQRMTLSYPFLVMLRSSVVIFSGFFLFPLLALITGKDFAGKISGTFLISLD